MEIDIFTDMGTLLSGLTNDFGKKSLTDAVDYQQFRTNAGEGVNWMLNIFKLASTNDVARDESNVQTPLNKNKEVSNELKIYQSIIDSPHEQASALGETFEFFVSLQIVHRS